MENLEDELKRYLDESDIWFLKEDFLDDIGSDNTWRAKFNPFLQKGYELIQKGKFTLIAFLNKIVEHVEENCDHDFLEENCEEIFSKITFFIMNNIKKKEEIEEIYPFLRLNNSHDNWYISKSALELIDHFGENFEDPKEARLLTSNLFGDWDDLLDWLTRGDNTAEANIAYCELQTERREIVIKAIYALDKQALKEPLKRAITETHIGWGINWAQMLAKKYLYKIGELALEDYLEILVGDISRCRADDYESKIDCQVALGHLYALDSNLAAKALLNIILKDINEGYFEFDRYSKLLELLVAVDKERIAYFSSELLNIDDKELSQYLIEVIHNLGK